MRILSLSLPFPRPPRKPHAYVQSRANEHRRPLGKLSSRSPNRFVKIPRYEVSVQVLVHEPWQEEQAHRVDGYLVIFGAPASREVYHDDNTLLELHRDYDNA